MVLAGYRLGRILRQRSEQDTVYEATSLSRGTAAELRLVSGCESERRRHFQSRAAVLQGLRHPNLPTVYGFGETDEVLYVATARHEGVGLSDTARSEVVSPLRAVRLLDGVASALDECHSRGLVHGDVRLESMVIVRRLVEHPYLVDFLLEGGPDGDRDPSVADDVRGLATALSECLTGGAAVRDVPAELEELLSGAISSPRAGMTAGQLISEATHAVLAPVAPQPAPVAAPAAPAVPETKAAPAVPETKAAPAVPETEPPPAVPEPEPPPAPPEPAPAAPIPPAAEAAPAAPEARPQPQPETRPAKSPATTREPARPRRRLRVPVWVALVVVLAAAAAGFVLGRPGEPEDPPENAIAGDDVRVTLPEGWGEDSEPRAIPELVLRDSVGAEGPDAGMALVAGRLPGRLGSVYPSAVAERLDADPPLPRVVRLERYEALRYDGLESQAGRITLFVAPTSAGTLVAVCLPGAPRPGCPAAAASLELSGATASSLAEGDRFARRLAVTMRGLERRGAALSRRLGTAATSPGQARAARSLAGAYGDAGRALARPVAPPAAVSTQTALTSALAGQERAYARLGRAAARHDAQRFADARQDVRSGEVRLRRVLRVL